MLEEHTICSPTTGYCRKVWYLPGVTGDPVRIGLFLDGEFYVDRMEAPAVLQRLQAEGKLPPMVCVFVSHLDGAARHIDLTCNPRYTDFLVGDVLAWMRERHPELLTGGHLVAGISLSGLAAAHTALNHPTIFAQCLAHSGSFWWNQEWLLAQLSEAQPSKLAWWLSVGCKETEAGISHPPSGLQQEVTQIAACERFARALRTRNHTVHFHQYDGGHEIEPWKAELPEALTRLAKNEIK
ncbi:MAG: alpha/beta hydrolase-fold protein [Armatimonas sp.]